MRELKAIDYLPQWTKRAVTEMGGRDPLGLSRATERLTEYLMMGITTQTSRARYYSFYCWALWHIQLHEKPKRWAEFSAAFRRREAMLALSTLLSGKTGSLAGADEAGEQLARAKATREANTNFKVLPSSELGGYQQYYAGSLYHLRLTCRDEAQMDHIAEGIAEEIAKALDETLSRSSYVSKKGFLDARIPWRMLEDSAELLGLDAVHAPAAGDERRVLTQLFFALESRDENDRNRRLSLGHVLAVLDGLARAGAPLTGEDDWEIRVVYGPCYYGVLPTGQGKPKRFVAPPVLKACSSYTSCRET